MRSRGRRRAGWSTSAPSAAASALAVAVNPSGQVVGYSSTAGGETHAFSWTQAGGMVDLGTLGGSYSQRAAVNDSGQVVGVSDTTGGRARCTRSRGRRRAGWSTSAPSAAPPASPSAVNDSGQVVGDSDTASGADARVLVDAGGRDGRPRHPRRHRQRRRCGERRAARSSATAPPPAAQTHAFSWTQAGGMVDLGTLGGSSASPSAVNPSGQVVGYSDTTGDGATHAVLWQLTG